MEKNRKKLEEFLKKRFPHTVRIEKKIDIIQEIAESINGTEEGEYDELPSREKMKERHRQNGGRKIKSKIRR